MKFKRKTMKCFNRIALVLSIVLASYNVFGQSHGWTVNPADYSFNGQVTAVVFLGLDEVTIGTLGAFVDGTCRGFVDGSFFPPTGKTVFTVICYSNQASGETLTFQYYDPSDDSFYDINETIEFVSDMIEGSAASPLEYHITVNNPPVVINPISDQNLDEHFGTVASRVVLVPLAILASIPASTTGNALTVTVTCELTVVNPSLTAT